MIIFFIVIQLQLYAFSPHPSTPAGVAQWIEHRPVNQNDNSVNFFLWCLVKILKEDFAFKGDSRKSLTCCLLILSGLE